MKDVGFVTPGQMIEARLREREWSQRALAMVLGVSEKTVSSFMNGRTKIGNELALQLQAALAVDADDLLKLQASFELKKAQLAFRLDPALTTRATLFGDLPVSAMISRGWLPGVRDLWDSNLDNAICTFFKAKSIDEIEVLPHAAKKSIADSEASPAQMAWLYRVRQLAADYPAPKYSQQKLEAAIGKLKALLISSDAIRKVPRIMMEAGVRFVIVESLPGARIDGVCCWLDSTKPVIGVSLRFDRIDNFWFVLRHEIEHVLRGHGQGQVRLDTDMEKNTSEADTPEEEKLANHAAAEFCVPSDRLRDFIARKSPVFAERDIRGFAATLQVHPGIVAGQLQHQTTRYELFRNHLVNIRSIILPTAEHDGWGDVAQIEV